MTVAAATSAVSAPSPTLCMTLNPAQRQTLSWLLIAAVALAVLWALSPVLMPFVLGAGLAYALHPAVERLAARKMPRVLAVSLVVVGTVISPAVMLSPKAR